MRAKPPHRRVFMQQRRPEAQGWRGVYFSQPICGADRSLCSPHIRRRSAHVGTIDVFTRKMARPAGFEPATPGLEGRKFPI